ncbi:MAG: cytochrome c [Bacteroidota bacterium]
MSFGIHKWKWLGIIAALAVITSSCYTDKSQRNVEYAPNMYNSLPLEPYSQTVYMHDMGGNYAAVSDTDKVVYFADGLSAQAPPEGTVPRSESWYTEEAYSPYPYPNDLEGYELAGVEVSSPLNNPDTNEKGYNCTEETYQKGKELFTRFCIVCHGANGKGNGKIVQPNGPYPPVPSYSGPTIVNLPEGKMFHTITHGKNLMGSYASQLTPNERWQVICYIQEFQKEGRVAEETAGD